MANRVTGRVEILLNGEALLNKAGAVASGIGLSGEQNFELKEVMGDGGLHGYVEEPVLAMLEVTLSDRDDISLNDIAKVREDGTVIFRAAGGKGKTYTLDDATCTRNLSITGGEGETPVKFLGRNWIEDIQ